MRTVALVGESLGVLFLAAVNYLAFLGMLYGRQDAALSAISPYRTVAAFIWLLAGAILTLYIVARLARRRAWPWAALGVALSIAGIVAAALPL